MSMTDETLNVILYVDEAQAPLARGQQISGKIIAMVPDSRPPGKKDALIQPERNAPAVLQGGSLYVSPRYRDESWDDFRAGKEITVNVSFLDSQKKEVARGIGHAHLGNTYRTK